MRFVKIFLPVVVVSGLSLFQLSSTSAQNSVDNSPGKADEHEHHQSMSGHEGHNMDHSGHDMSGHDMNGHEDHSMHMKMMQQRNFSVSSEQYSMPEVSLLDVDGEKVSMKDLLSADEPVALNFIFTTCTTICPVMTATFAQMQRELDTEQLQQLQVISISIDPEYDRPEVLRAYAGKYNASGTWMFLTGSSIDIENVLRAFDAYAGSKMNHQPLTFLRKDPQQPWLRVDGLASGKDLASLVDQYMFD
jgi:protein SCO1/2